MTRLYYDILLEILYSLYSLCNKLYVLHTFGIFLLCSQTQTELELERLRFVYVDYIFQSSNDQNYIYMVSEVNDQMETCLWIVDTRWSSWLEYSHLRMMAKVAVNISLICATAFNFPKLIFSPTLTKVFQLLKPSI